MNKIKSMILQNKSKIALAMIMCVMVMSMAVCFASGDNAFSSTTLSPIVTALQGAVTITDIVNLFTSGVVVALPLILVWFGARWVYRRFTNAVQGGQD